MAPVPRRHSGAKSLGEVSRLLLVTTHYRQATAAPAYCFLPALFWRRRQESNLRVKVLQTFALPLGYAATFEQTTS